VYAWSKSFKEGQTKVENVPHARQPKTSVKQVNAEQTDDLIQDDCGIMVHKLAEIVGITVSTGIPRYSSLHLAVSL
jgi:hypothetical protein